MTATLERSTRDPAGSGARPVLPGRSRTQRVPVVVVAVLVALVAALGFGLWARNLAGREPVLVVARDLPAGARITSADLTVGHVAADAAVRAVAADALDLVIGRVVTASLPEGSLLHPDHVADAPVLEPGVSLVGVTVAAGQGPTAKLEAGLRVMVVWTPTAAMASDTARVLVPDAVIDAVSVVGRDADLAGGDGVQHVSLRVPTAVAADVVAAAATNQARLVLVGSE